MNKRMNRRLPAARLGVRGLLRQRGSIPILAVIFVVVALVLAVAIDGGYAFMKRRDLQRTADMAALAGAQALPGCSGSYSSLASNSVTANLGATDAAAVTIATTCGVFTPPSSTATGPGTYVVNNSTTANAISVTLTQSVPSFFVLAPNRSIVVSAIARKLGPVATFSVDSGILALNTSASILGPLLSNLGVSNLSAYVGYGGQLAGVTVTPGGLLKALGVPVSADVSVASLNAVAAVKNLTVGQLLSATQTAVAAQNGALSASVTALNGLVSLFANSSALNIPISLLGTSSSSGILANLEAAGTVTNALTANVGVMDLINAAIVAANGTNGLSVPSLSVLGSTVTVKASIVSPPQIAVGGVGATATSAQVRLYMNVNTNQSLLGGILNAVGTSVTLPLVLEVAQSTGTLTALSCGPTAATTSATIQVTSGLVNMCVGAFPSNIATSSASCTTLMTGRTQIASILGLTINSGVNMSLVTSSTPPPTHTFSGTLPQTWTTSAQISLSQVLSQLLSALLSGILGDVGTNPSSTVPGASSTYLGKALIDAVPSASQGLAISTVNSYLSTAASGVNSLTSGLTGTISSLLTLNLAGVGTGLTSVLTGVGGLVGGLLTGLTSLLSDLLCLGITQCKYNAVASLLNSTSSFGGGLVSILFSVLNPVLSALSTVLNSLLSALGIQIGITNVTMMNINCQAGAVQLVY